MGASPQHGCSTTQAVPLIEKLSKRRTSDLGTHKPLLFPTSGPISLCSSPPFHSSCRCLGGSSPCSGPAGGSAAEAYRELPFWASHFNGITYTLDLWLWSQRECWVKSKICTQTHAKWKEQSTTSLALLFQNVLYYIGFANTGRRF